MAERSGSWPVSDGVAEAPSLEEELLAIIAHECAVDRDALTPNATFGDVGVNSIDVVSTLNAIEERFGVYIAIDESMANARTVGDLLNILISAIEQARAPGKR